MSTGPLSSLKHTKQHVGLTADTVSRPLTEYRCACGKLLFKGSLFLSVVETKCKRCGSVRVFRHVAIETISFSSVTELMSKLRGAHALMSGCIVFLANESSARHAHTEGASTDLSTHTEYARDRHAVPWKTRNPRGS